ncbi:MAG: AraC family transcriptional regulator ligand-binding domain-containing protein [Geminicoccaceae bacterium]
MQDIFVNCFTKQLDRRGLNWRPLARTHGLGFDGQPTGTRVLTHIMQAFVRDAQRMADDPLLGWAAGSYELRDYGLMGYAALNAPDLRTALRLIVELSRLVSYDSIIALYEHHGEATLALRNSTNSTVSEFCLPLLLRALKELAGQDFRPLRLGVNQPDPARRARLADEAGMQVEDIGAPIALVTFPARLLDRPIPCADAQLARTLRPLWMEELATLQDRNDKLQELQTAILPLLPRGTPTPSHVAAVLGISTRALQAELDNLGTDLPAMVDSVRRVLCSRKLARGQTSLVQAARILGFTDVEAFVDAHQRWWASPPCDGRGRLLH